MMKPAKKVANCPPVRRITVLLVGSTVIVAGVAMLALPGPGWGAIFLGLAIMATEFEWARRLLRWASDKVRTAIHWVRARRGRSRQPADHQGRSEKGLEPSKL